MAQVKCSSPKCAAPIAFLKLIRKDGTFSPKKQPIDPEPSADGNVRIVEQQGEKVARVLSGEELARARRQGEQLFKHHRATCKDLESFPESRFRPAPARVE